MSTQGKGEGGFELVTFASYLHIYIIVNVNNEPLWFGCGANLSFYSIQSSHDTSLSTKNKMSLPTPNQNEKYPNSHATIEDPRPRKTQQTHADSTWVWPLAGRDLTPNPP